MRQLCMTVLAGVTLSACAADGVIDQAAGDDAIEVGTAEQAISTIIGENWNSYVPGPINGQGGWAGNCVVTDGIAPDRYLRCVGDRTAQKYLGEQGAGSFTMLLDIAPNANVVDGTHGKLLLEQNDTTSFQILVGVCNVRVASRLGPENAVLLPIPGCTTPGDPPGPKYRVICNWSTGATVLSCGASVLPADPTTYVNLQIDPSRPLLPFNRARIMTFPFAGATLVDKFYIWRN